MSYLAAYHQGGGAVCAGCYRKNRDLAAVFHVLHHPGLNEMLKDVRTDVVLKHDRQYQLPFKRAFDYKVILV